MRTPFGQECKYFYGDYFRGKNSEECRLIGSTTTPSRWNVVLCKNCPVPGILLANGCEHMALTGFITKGWFTQKRHIKVEAFCKKNQRGVVDARIGCGLCHIGTWQVSEDK